CNNTRQAIALERLANQALRRRCSNNRLGDLGPCGVVLISRQRDSRQNTDNRNHDHQLDKGKTFLHLSFHFSTPFVLWIAVGLSTSKQKVCQQTAPTLRALQDLGFLRGWAWQSHRRSSRKIDICPDRYQLEPAECDVFCQVQGLPCRRAGARQPEPAASMESVLCRQAGCCTIVGIISVGMMPLTGSRF